MKNRIFLFLFIPLVVYILLSSQILFLVFTEIVVCNALYEFYTMLNSNKKKVYLYPGMIIGFILPILVYYNPMIINIFLIASIFFVSIIQMLSDHEENFTEKLALTFFGIMYIPLLFSYAIRIQNFQNGGIIITYAFASVWACDTFAYLIGSKFGKHKLTKISPKKSIEGVVGGLIGVIIVSYIFRYFTPYIFKNIKLLPLSILLTFFAVFGDLLESKIKRDTHFKDSSNILGGHGGFLDRFDSLLFVIPFIYFYWRLLCFINW